MPPAGIFVRKRSSEVECREVKNIRCIAWDFDGVLNRNVVNGRFPWMDRLDEKFGVDGEVFRRSMFTGNFVPVPLLEHLKIRLH